MCKLLVESFWTRILVQTSKSPLQEIKTYDPELTWSSCVSAPSSSGTGSTAVCRSCSMRRVWRLHNWENRLQQSIAYLFFEWNVTSCYAASTHTYMNTELKKPVSPIILLVQDMYKRMHKPDNFLCNKRVKVGEMSRHVGQGSKAVSVQVLVLLWNICIT